MGMEGGGSQCRDFPRRRKISVPTVGEPGRPGLSRVGIFFGAKRKNLEKYGCTVLDLIFRIMDNTSPCETSLVRMVN